MVLFYETYELNKCLLSNTYNSEIINIQSAICVCNYVWILLCIYERIRLRVCMQVYMFVYFLTHLYIHILCIFYALISYNYCKQSY